MPKGIRIKIGRPDFHQGVFFALVGGPFLGPKYQVTFSYQ